MKRTIVIELNEREAATILAALELWQEHCRESNDYDHDTEHFTDIDPLDARGLEKLCELFNDELAYRLEP